MIIRKLRLKHAWSQEQLSHLSGLSIRTIQRIEKGQNPGLESLKSLAAVFEVDLNELQRGIEMTSDVQVSDEEINAIEHVKEIKSFYSLLIIYILVSIALLIFNYLTTPEFFWVWWTIGGWGISLIIQGMGIFELPDFFDAKWEKKQIEKKLGRKL